MSEWTSHYIEVIVRVEPSRRLTHKDTEVFEVGEEQHSFDDGIEQFDLFIYGNDKAATLLPKLKPQIERVPGQPEELCDLSLFSLETITFNSNYYRKYLSLHWRSMVNDSEATFTLSRERLFGQLSPGLRQLFRIDEPEQPRLRIWWDTPSLGLVDIPWEILLFPSESRHTSFVRGLPPEQSIPKTPVGQKLRLALIHDSTFEAKRLLEALKNVSGLQVVEMTDKPRQSLRKAINDGFELIHLVADSSVSLAFDGCLYLSKSKFADISSETENTVLRFLLRQLIRLYALVAPLLPFGLSFILSNLLYRRIRPQTLTSAELSVLQRGRRLTILGLSAPEDSSSEISLISKRMAYRAFACLGGSRLPLPSVVAPIGVLDGEQETMFWGRFYQALRETKSVEEAMFHSMSTSNSFMPIALFLRQQSGQTFEEREPYEKLNLALLSAELQQSRRTLALLRAARLRETRLDGIVKEFEEREIANQKRLLAQLKPWLED